MSQPDLTRCDREIAAIEAEIRAGNPDLEGTLRCPVDWHAERRMIEAEIAALEKSRGSLAEVAI